LFVVVAEVVEEDAGGGRVEGCDGENYPRGVEGREKGGGEDELPVEVLRVEVPEFEGVVRGGADELVVCRADFEAVDFAGVADEIPAI